MRRRFRNLPSSSPRDRAFHRRIPELMRRGGGGRFGFQFAAASAEAAMEALAPAHQYRADTVTLSGGNVATVPNRRGAGAMVVAAGTMAAPAADALFAGAHSLVFSGTQYLDSNLPAADFARLSSGAGSETFHVFSPTSGTGMVSTTRNDNATTEVGHSLYFGGGNINRYRLTNGSAQNVATDAGTLVYDAATYQNVSLSTSEPSHYVSFVRETAAASGFVSGTLSAAAPLRTLRIGAHGNLAAIAQMRWCETLIFTRVLSEYERQIVREYIAARYGIAAPSVTGLDRDILSMVPFAQPRADYYSSAASKVTAWLDRARPGHTLLQASGALQLANPASDALFGGQLVGNFTGGQWYQSSLPAAAWTFLNNGAGCETFTVYSLNVASGSQAMWSTWGSGGGTAAGSWFYCNTGTSPVVQVANAVGTSIGSTGAIGGATANVATYFGHALRSADSPSLTARRKGTQVYAGNLAGAAAANAPIQSLMLGNLNGSAFGANAKWAESLFFDRVLSVSERARVQAYFQNRYGIAA